MTSRVLVPEILDDLPASDAAAQHSRADLRRLNALMGHAKLIAKECAERRARRDAPYLARLCDLGGGDGTVMLNVARQLGGSCRAATTRPAFSGSSGLRLNGAETPQRGVCHLTIIDQQDTLRADTREAFDELGWNVSVERADVFTALQQDREFDAITANLFLHHFEDELLRELLAAVAERTNVFIACEPRRSTLALLASRSVGLIGCNYVTRHDAVVSVRAGFCGGELSALWPARVGWQVEERAAGLFSHLFVARRK